MHTHIYICISNMLLYIFTSPFYHLLLNKVKKFYQYILARRIYVYKLNEGYSFQSAFHNNYNKLLFFFFINYCWFKLLIYVPLLDKNRPI